MQAIIDSPYNLGNHAARLFSEGVRSVIRYYNNKNSQTFPEKCLTRAEATKLHAAGLSLAVVYQQRGGADSTPAGHIEDFSPELAERDGNMAVQRAGQVGQPEGSGIYFGVDHDFYLQRDLAVIKAYFTKVKSIFAGRYRIGVYGSGTVCEMLRTAALAELFWLPKSSGWSGSRDFLAAGKWTIYQSSQELREPWGNFDYDANQFNPTFADFGQFTLGADPAIAPQYSIALYEVIATGGLNLRGGPGTGYPVRQTIAEHKIVQGLGLEGEWMKVDATGDGLADGFVKVSFLKAVSGGLPAPNPAPLTPLAVAEAELAIRIEEVAGSQHNPRIVMYHSLTEGGSTPDETARCSSFANYCVTKAGGTGTRSKWARSWHDEDWGQDVTSAPRRGDLVVWHRRRPGTNGGHVAFFIEDLGDRIKVLGGNQSNRVCYTTYPKDGMAGTTHYKLLSIRRD